MVDLVGVRGFEPPAPASRTQCSTRLSYTPAKAAHIAPGGAFGKAPSQTRSLASRPAMQMRQMPQQRRDAVHDLVEFARFRRGEQEPEAAGLGLGLWLVKSIIERHGGTVAFARTGEGRTRFTLTLPAPETT